MKCDRCLENKRSGHFIAVYKSVNSKAIVCEDCAKELDYMQRDTFIQWWENGKAAKEKATEKEKLRLKLGINND